MRKAVAAFAIVFALPSPAAAVQSFELECETEDVHSISVGGRNPIRRVKVEMIRISVDPAARTAVIRYENADGTPGTSLRNISVLTDNEILFCQADTCQQPVTREGVTTTATMTDINLRTGRLSRRVDSSAPDPALNAQLTSTLVRSGICRRI